MEPERREASCISTNWASPTNNRGSLQAMKNGAGTAMVSAPSVLWVQVLVAEAHPLEVNHPGLLVGLCDGVLDGDLFV